jgi:hypothetical protein
MRRAFAFTGLALGLAAPLPIVLATYSALHASQGHTATVHAIPMACTGSVITVHGSDPVGCDLTPPQRLDVTGVTLAECDDMGGEPIAYVYIVSDDDPITCEGVDF